MGACYVLTWKQEREGGAAARTHIETKKTINASLMYLHAMQIPMESQHVKEKSKKYTDIFLSQGKGWETRLGRFRAGQTGVSATLWGQTGMRRAKRRT